MKRKILTNLAALTLLVSAVSTHGSFRGPEYGGYYGHEYGYSTYGDPTYGYGPSIDGPAYVGVPWGYGFDTYGFDGWSDYRAAAARTESSRTFENDRDSAGP